LTPAPSVAGPDTELPTQGTLDAVTVPEEEGSDEMAKTVDLPGRIYVTRGFAPPGLLPLWWKDTTIEVVPPYRRGTAVLIRTGRYSGLAVGRWDEGEHWGDTPEWVQDVLNFRTTDDEAEDIQHWMRGTDVR